MRSLVVATVFGVVVLASACGTDPSNNSASNPDAGGAAEGGPKDGGLTPPVSDQVEVVTETLDVEGVARQYVLAKPKTLERDKPYPLVFVFHGDGGTGETMRATYPFDVTSGKDAYVAYLSGLDQTWDLHTPSSTNKDMKFVDALVKSLRTTYLINDGKVFGTGFSAGAFFINQLACRKTGFFRGIVAHAGGAPDEPDDPDATLWPSGYTKCKGQSGGVAAMVVHGTDDGDVGVDSGEFSATYWAALGGCQETRSASPPSPCLKHDGCPAENPVLWCLIPGLGHAVWDQGIKEGWAFMQSL